MRWSAAEWHHHSAGYGGSSHAHRFHRHRSGQDDVSPGGTQAAVHASFRRSVRTATASTRMAKIVLDMISPWGARGMFPTISDCLIEAGDWAGQRRLRSDFLCVY